MNEDPIEPSRFVLLYDGAAVRHRLALVAALVLALGLTTLPALAYWTGGVSGSGAATGGTLPSGATPNVGVSGTSIAVSWAQSTIPGLGPIGTLTGGGYVLTRYAEGSTTPIAPGTACNGLHAGAGDPLVCTEAGVPEGRWVYSVSARLQSWVGPEGAASAVAVVDLTPPTTSADLSPPANGAGWSNGDVTVNLTATDNAGGSGVASIAHSAAGAETIPPSIYSAPFGITAEGITTLSFNATDVAGNAEAPQVLDVRVDRTQPTGSITAPAPGGVVWGVVTVSSDSADALSGVAIARFEVSPAGAGTWMEFGTVTASPFDVPLDTTALAEGAYELRVTTEDVAGNLTTSNAVAVIGDNLTPFGADIQGGNGGVLGMLDAGDSVTYTFSEPMLPGSIVSGWDGSPIGVSVDVRNQGVDRLLVSGAELGRVDLGSRAVVSGNAQFVGTLVQSSSSIFTLTIGACTAGCGSVLASVGPTTYTWRPSNQARDLAGNRSSNAPVTQTGAPLQNM